MSQSTGNDANPGTQASPWQTLAKAASYYYLPGYTIYLKAGDTWAETFAPFGHGNRGANQWVTVTSYGAGANPKIAPGGAANAAIVADHAALGGWKFVNIDAGSAQVAGFDFTCSNSSHADGLWIENSTITSITGMAVAASGADPITPVAGFNEFCGNAIHVDRYDNVTIKNVTVPSGSDMFGVFQACNNLTIDTVSADHCSRAGIWLSNRLSGTTYNVGPNGVNDAYSNAVIKNSHIAYAGTTGMYFGVAGIQLNGGSSVTIQDTEIDHTGAGSSAPDRVGVDFEGYGGSNQTLLRCNIHDNNGPAVLIFNSSGGTGAGQTGTKIQDCTIASNNQGNVSPLCGFIRIVNNETNNVTVTGNTITRKTAGACGVGQCLNNVGDTSGDPQGLQDTYPTRFTVSGNTVTN